MDKHAGRSNRLDKLLNTIPNYSNLYQVWDDFMVLKGRKGLYTLLQETWSAFFDIDNGPVYRRTDPVEGALGEAGMSSISNRYSSQDSFKVDDANDPQFPETMPPVAMPATNANPRPEFDGNKPGSSDNRYSGGEGSYDFTYMSQQGSSYVDPPDNSDVLSQALQGFVLGQIFGGQDATIQESIRKEAQNITADYFRQSAANTNDDSLKDFYENLAGVVESTDRISQLYVPGWGRPAENYLTRKPLQESLNQNLLLPPSIRSSGITSPLSMPGNDNDNGTGPPGQGFTEKTFQTLYTRNRSGKVGGVPIVNPLFNNGILGGSAINMLQEPMDRSAKIVKADPTAPMPTPTTVPFSYVADDARYLTYDRKETGFTSNGPNTNAQPSKMEPAVDDVSAVGEAGPVTQRGIARETISLGQGQFFPFTFSTLNKKDHVGALRHQVCYLQAIINSLGESYTPTWASKHFFGRTEQTHTYTFTDRTIDLSFTIFANEMRQLQNVYERVLWLAQQCYPDFDITGRVSEGPLVAVRIGDLFQYKAGMIRSLSYDWMFAGGKWEMTAGMRMPQGVTVTMSYQIMHNTVPSRNTDFYGGPAGGLNAATERYRQIGREDAVDAFDPFDTTAIGEVGYGQRLIPEGETGGEHRAKSFLDDVKARNYAGVEAEQLSAWNADDLKVPIGIGGTTTDNNPNGVVWAE
tara:strand:- start:179 stop:2254 length:2076 start_codon:yes stop_codon:yes gene_type:complete